MSTLFSPIPSVLLTILLLIPAVTSAEELSESLYKNGPRVHEAFREVVSNASQWTVEIECNNEKVALGVIVESDGYILTKASQLHGSNIRVRLANRVPQHATIVGIHLEHDLALLQIPVKKLPAVEWSKQQAEIGGWVVTAGPGDLPVSVGVVSVLPRKITPSTGLLGISYDDRTEGVVITEVAPDSGAEEAGLQVGDVVLSVAGLNLKDGVALRNAVRNHSPGESLMLRIKRGNKQLDLLAKLGNPASLLKTKNAIQNTWGGELSIRRGGFNSVLQHDSFLNPEDCGGPLLDLTGKALGLNIARAGRTESFALLTSEILSVLPQLKSGTLAPEKLRPNPEELFLGLLPGGSKNEEEAPEAKPQQTPEPKSPAPKESAPAKPARPAPGGGLGKWTPENEEKEEKQEFKKFQFQGNRGRDKFNN